MGLVAKLSSLLLSSFLILNCADTNNAETDNYSLECKSAYGYMDKSLEDLGLDNSVSIKFGNGNKPIIHNPYENEIIIESNGENVVVQSLSSNTKYNIVASGTTENGSLKIYGNHEIGLYLNGVNITNPNGPAINFQSRQKNSVYLVEETENYIADGNIYEYTKEDAKGTFFSEGHVHFHGCGSLEITAKYAHAIVVDNSIEIENGRITVAHAARDGIHANDEINVRGGILKISSTGDIIQSESSPIRISGGKIIAQSTGVKSHGITSTDSIIISNDADIKIDVLGNASKGIKSDGFVAINGGKIDIRTRGNKHINNSINPPDTSSATGIKADGDMEITGGEITVKTSGTDAKGINIKGNLTISNGDIKIVASDDGIKVHGNLLASGGNVCAYSLNKQDIDCNGMETVKSGVINGDKCGRNY